MPVTKKVSLGNKHIEQQQLLSLINNMADGVIATDENGLVVLYNGAALNILDSNASLTSKKLNQICSLIDKNNQQVDFSHLVLSSKKSHNTRDLRIKYSDNSAINVYLSIAPVKLGYGKNDQKGYVLLIRDITHEKSLEDERNEFISVVSHELRTPVAIAEGDISNAELLVEKGADLTQIKRILSQAHTQILFLSGLINDLATLGRAERNALELDIEEINPHELVQELVDNYTTQATGKGLDIKAKLDSNLQLLKSSKLYVREILQNFITNAVKYTEKGHVIVGANQKPSGVMFMVSDTGIGISKADQDKVFDKFFRSEDFRTRSTNGTGLGLYVVLKLAHLIHAEITLTSELDKGSEFFIFVPNLK